MVEHVELVREFQEFAKTAPTAKSVMERIAQRLHEEKARHNWVGFYLIDPADPGILMVGPFVGSFTPKARIPLNTGLCGAAASTRQTVVVDDVTKDPRYLAGSSMVISEIVVPISVNNRLVGELDVEATSPPRSSGQSRISSKSAPRLRVTPSRRDSHSDDTAQTRQ